MNTKKKPIKVQVRTDECGHLCAWVTPEDAGQIVEEGLRDRHLTFMRRTGEPTPAPEKPPFDAADAVEDLMRVADAAPSDATMREVMAAAVAAICAGAVRGIKA